MILQLTLTLMVSLLILVLSPFWLSSKTTFYKPAFSQEKPRWDRQKEVLLKKIMGLRGSKNRPEGLSKEEQENLLFLEHQYLDLLKREDLSKGEVS